MTSLRPYADPIAPFFGSIASSIHPYALSFALPAPEYLFQTTYSAVQIPFGSEVRRAIDVVLTHLFNKNLMQRISIDYKYLFAVLLAFLPIASLFAASENVHELSDEFIRRIKTVLFSVRQRYCTYTESNPIHQQARYSFNDAHRWHSLQQNVAESRFVPLSPPSERSFPSTPLRKDKDILTNASPSPFIVHRAGLHASRTSSPIFNRNTLLPSVQESDSSDVPVASSSTQDVFLTDSESKTRSSEVVENEESPTSYARVEHERSCESYNCGDESVFIAVAQQAGSIENFHLQAHLIDLRHTSQSASSRTS